MMKLKQLSSVFVLVSLYVLSLAACVPTVDGTIPSGEITGTLMLSTASRKNTGCIQVQLNRSVSEREHLTASLSQGNRNPVPLAASAISLDETRQIATIIITPSDISSFPETSISLLLVSPPEDTPLDHARALIVLVRHETITVPPISVPIH